MSDQLSWGVKFSDVIGQFAERVGTPLVRRAITLVAEVTEQAGKFLTFCHRSQRFPG